MSSNNKKNKKVVIVGAGYAGLSVAEILDKDDSLDVTVVEMREGFLLHKMASLRASVIDAWSNKVLIPLKHSLENATIVYSKVTEVNEKDKVVVLESGKSLPFDAVIIATGARNLSPSEPPASIRGVEATLLYFSKISKAIEDAPHIVVYGAGLAGIELCGEILGHYPHKIVTLVNGENRHFSSLINLKKAQTGQILKVMSHQHLNFINNDDVVSPQVPTEKLSEALPNVEVPDQEVKLKSGRTLKAHLLIVCFGPQHHSNRGMIPEEWQSKENSGEISVDEKTLQVTNCNFAFALGDVADTKHEKLAFMHIMDARLVAKNVKSYLSGKHLVSRPVPKATSVIVSFGQGKGCTFFLNESWLLSILRG